MEYCCVFMIRKKKQHQLNEATALMSKDNVTRLLKIFFHAHFCSYFKAVRYILLIKPRIIECSFKRRISGAHWNMDWASVASFLNIQTLESPKPAQSPARIMETPLFCIRSSAERCGQRWSRCRNIERRQSLLSSKHKDWADMSPKT